MASTIPAFQPVGFIDYGSSDPDLIYSAALTSLPAGASAIGAGAANINYTSAGVQLTNTGAIRLPALTAAQILALNNGGQISFEVESGFFASTYTGVGNEHIFYASEDGTTVLALRKGNAGSNVSVYNGGALANVATLSQIGASSDGETHNKIHILWDNKTITVYKDNLPILKNTWSSKATGQFTQINIGGTGAGGFGSITSFRIRNFAISTRPVMLPSRRTLNDFIVLGHSFTVNGDYPNANLALIGGATSGSYQDGGWMPQLHRLVNRRGYTFGLGRMTSYGVASTKIATGVNNCSTQLTTAVAAGHRKPDGMVLWTGVNDVLSLVGSLTSQFLTDFQTVIDAALVINPDMQIIVPNMPAPTGYTGATWTQANIDAGNAYIAQLPGLYPNNVVVADVFTDLGGWDNKVTSDFVADQLHLDKPGYLKAARTIYNASLGFI